jgi:hypothetical protein
VDPPEGFGLIAAYASASPEATVAVAAHESFLAAVRSLEDKGEDALGVAATFGRAVADFRKKGRTGKRPEVAATLTEIERLGDAATEILASLHGLREEAQSATKAALPTIREAVAADLITAVEPARAAFEAAGAAYARTRGLVHALRSIDGTDSSGRLDDYVHTRVRDLSFQTAVRGDLEGILSRVDFGLVSEAEAQARADWPTIKAEIDEAARARTVGTFESPRVFTA